MWFDATADNEASSSAPAADQLRLTSSPAGSLHLPSTAADDPPQPASEPDVWFDAGESFACWADPRSALSYSPEEGKPASLLSSAASTGTVSVDKLLNMSAQQLEPCLTSVLDKGPKFSMTQRITKRTFNEVEVGFERAVYALRWKIDIENRRAGQPIPSHGTPQLKPRFADNDASVPRPAPLETERAMSKLKRKLLGIYRNHRASAANVRPDQEQALVKLSHKDDIVVKPSDKCKGFVIMDKGTY